MWSPRRKKRKKSSNRLQSDAGKSKRANLLTSPSRSTIDRLRTIIEGKEWDELRNFLSTEKGFRPEQFGNSFLLFHFVAGRQFETEEEAHESLSYALVGKNEDKEIEKQSWRKLRPLHCACKWGNIFGVEWLVSRGANLNVEDDRGHTPYSCACASSVDTMKKMLCLENHGYRLLPGDIVWAAENRFLSSEKADEIFRYLVSKKGLSVNAIEDKNTPLHIACSDGVIFGVKWLVEHKASVNNSFNKWGETPFMCACGSSIDRLLKVRYLTENGADIRVKDHAGKTAFSHATDSYSKVSDDVKDVLRYLVIEKGLDINSVYYEKGRTPLLKACSHDSTSFGVIQQLIELGADVSARDEDKRNALHLAARNYSKVDKSIFNLLIKEGVDVTCQDKKGNAPHQVTNDVEIKALLQEHYDAALSSGLQQEMNTVASADPVEKSCNSESFPSDDASVPDNLMRTYAAIAASKWEEIGVLLGIASGEFEAIRNFTSCNTLRMYKVLEAWKNQAESPSVGTLLARFKEVGISRRAINVKFAELYG
ncbi:ankyrin repeat domain-containing protein 16-like [Oscarella lobularis]|uniref:ankyrin repeat domain-containing protein 16-like n=1 Tax=Oscarella lobularis TaxID=121494 RepID=UPI0033144057